MSSRETATRRGATDVAHLDMDCFFAAVEVRDAPELSGKPVVVGGLGPRGVVASASYEARVFGVKSAMPMAVARRLCPTGVFLSGRMAEYSSTSAQLLGVLRETTPLVEPVALDEAFLDLSGAHGLFGSSPEIASHLRGEVESRLGLACSVGVGRTKLVAKLASRAAKPRPSPTGLEPGPGVVVIGRDDEPGFLRPLPVGALPGAGPSTVARLGQIGVRTVGDLADLEPALLERLFGRAHGKGLIALAHGDDERAVEPERDVRSIGHEETFDVDDANASSLRSTILEQSSRVAERCRANGLVGRTVTVKVRFGDFTTITRSKTLSSPTDIARDIGSVAADLLGAVDTGRGVRLLGVSLSNLVPPSSSPEQLALFTDADKNSDTHDAVRIAALEATTDAIRNRFGAASIRSVSATARRRADNGPTRQLLDEVRQRGPAEGERD